MSGAPKVSGAQGVPKRGTSVLLRQREGALESSSSPKRRRGEGFVTDGDLRAAGALLSRFPELARAPVARYQGSRQITRPQAAGLLDPAVGNIMLSIFSGMLEAWRMGLPPLTLAALGRFLGRKGAGGDLARWHAAVHHPLSDRFAVVALARTKEEGFGEVKFLPPALAQRFSHNFAVLDMERQGEDLALVPGSVRGKGALDVTVAFLEERMGIPFGPVGRALAASWAGPKNRPEESGTALTIEDISRFIAQPGSGRMVSAIHGAIFGRPLDAPFAFVGFPRGDGAVTGLKVVSLSEASGASASALILYLTDEKGKAPFLGAAGVGAARMAIGYVEGRLGGRLAHPVERTLAASWIVKGKLPIVSSDKLQGYLQRRDLPQRLSLIHAAARARSLPGIFALVGQEVRRRTIFALRIVPPEEELAGGSFRLLFAREGSELFLRAAEGRGSQRLALAFLGRKLRREITDSVEIALAMSWLAEGGRTPQRQQAVGVREVANFVQSPSAGKGIARLFHEVTGRGIRGDFAFVGRMNGKGKLSGLKILPLSEVKWKDGNLAIFIFRKSGDRYALDLTGRPNAATRVVLAQMALHKPPGRGTPSGAAAPVSGTPPAATPAPQPASASASGAASRRAAGVMVRGGLEVARRAPPGMSDGQAAGRGMMGWGPFCPAHALLGRVPSGPLFWGTPSVSVLGLFGPGILLGR